MKVEGTRCLEFPLGYLGSFPSGLGFHSRVEVAVLGSH